MDDELREDLDLIPLLVDGSGRDGTTLTMQLLGTAAAVAFDRIYPFEQRYFSYLLHWAQMPTVESWDGERWNLDSIAHSSSVDRVPYVGSLPWRERSLIAGEPPFWRDVFGAAWTEFSRRARASVRAQLGDRRQPVVYYAQKNADSRKLDFAALPPLKLICLIRDPRDIWISSLAFHRRRAERGEAFLPLGPELSEEQYLTGFIEDQRERLRWLPVAQSEHGAALVRYDDLVGDLAAEAARLGGWLGVRFDADAVLCRRDEFADHITSGSTEESIERWRREMPEEVALRFWEAMGPELERLGFEP